MLRNFREQLQKEIIDFVTFPETHTIEQKELWKTKQKGGIKLINLEIKSDTCKVKWLLEMVSNPICNINLHIFTELLGRQKGDIAGRHLLFVENKYIKKQLKSYSTFYQQALLTITKYDRLKAIKKVEDWDEEHFFYNPLILTQRDATWNLTKIRKLTNWEKL